MPGGHSTPHRRDNQIETNISVRDPDLRYFPGFLLGTRFATVGRTHMPKKRTHSLPPLALTLDGSLLLNAAGQLNPTLFAELAQALSVRPSELFIGTRLSPAQRKQALNRFDDAAAEAAARIHGLNAQSSSRGRSRKTYKKV